jgi:serine kinase of HPr protein (carbohydrate metabolism regulator)
MSEATIHASCVAIGGRAVLIAGASGAGKSDLALRLIDRGAALVSDDYTIVEAVGERLLARPPENIAGRMEVRSIGILANAFESRVPVALLIDLDLPPERLPEPRARALCGVELPLLGLNGLEPSAPIKVEAALLLHGLGPLCPP